jgi:hypothetical protein
MEIDYRGFAFVITLAGVINGLGIVRVLSSFAEFLRTQGRYRIKNYWVFDLWASYQFLMHILLWWSLWNMRHLEALNFGKYIYLLTGPIVLYLGTSLLAPAADEDPVDLRAHFFQVRRAYFTILGLFWLWGIFSWPMLLGAWPPTIPLLAANFAIAAILCFTERPKVHAALVIAAWVTLFVFVARFGMWLGEVGDLSVR